MDPEINKFASKVKSTIAKNSGNITNAMSTCDSIDLGIYNNSTNLISNSRVIPENIQSVVIAENKSYNLEIKFDGPYGSLSTSLPDTANCILKDYILYNQPGLMQPDTVELMLFNRENQVFIEYRIDNLPIIANNNFVIEGNKYYNIFLYISPIDNI